MCRNRCSPRAIPTLRLRKACRRRATPMRLLRRVCRLAIRPKVCRLKVIRPKVCLLVLRKVRLKVRLKAPRRTLVLLQTWAR